MVSIDKPTLAKFIQKHIKSNVSEQLANIIVSNLSNSCINGVLKLLLTEEPIYEFQPGDYFKMKPITYHLNNYFYEDELLDLGLYVDGYVFGEIVSSNDWNSEHDPYYDIVKCKLFYGADVQRDENISIFGLYKVDKQEIPYFNGSNIRKFIEQSHTGVSDSETDSSTE